MKPQNVKEDQIEVLPVPGHMVLDIRPGSGFENCEVRYIGQVFDPATRTFQMLDKPVVVKNSKYIKKQLKLGSLVLAEKGKR